jgi:hypothetical protein
MTPHDDSAPPELDPFTDAELMALELRWYEGRMLPYTDWLMDFIARHRTEILLSADNSRDTAGLLAATKRVIVQRGSMHMVGELKDQMREIENELWYRGEKGEHDRAGIKQEWTARYANAWRRWRIKEYLFVADRCSQRIATFLTTPDAADEPRTL